MIRKKRIKFKEGDTVFIDVSLGKKKDNLFRGKFIVKKRNGRLLAIRKDGWGVYINSPSVRRSHSTKGVRVVLFEKFK